MSAYEIREIEVDGLDEPMLSAFSNKDGGYIGSPETARKLCNERGITPELIEPSAGCCSIGFCEREQKWYGWSHRALYGFGVGSSVKIGDCAYVADTPEGLIEDRARFFGDLGPEHAQRARDECQILPDRSGIRILHTPLTLPMANSIEEALDPDAELEEQTIFEDAWSIEKCGRGGWTAETLEDAKQMARDFAESVS